LNAVVIIIGIMLEKFQKSEFTRNVFTLTSGTTIAQAIPVLLSPVLSRLFSPEDFGILALFMSVAAVLSVIATGRYELAIMIPENKKDAYNVLALSLIITFITAILALVLVILFKRPAMIFFEEPAIGSWLYLIPVVVLFAGVYQSFNYWSTRQKTFKLNAASRVSQSTANITTSLGLGVAKAGPAGLIAGYIVGQIVAGLILFINFFKNIREFLNLISVKGIKSNAKKYRNFLIINTPHAFVDSLQDNGIVYLIMYFFSKHVLGSYSFAFRVLKAPVSLIGGAIFQVFYQEASAAASKGENLRPKIMRIYKTLFVAGFPLFLILFLFTPDIFAFVFGENYRDSGEIARIITPWLFLNFLASPVSCVTLVMNKQKVAFYFTITDITLKVLAITIGGLTNDFHLAFIIMSLLCSLLLIFALFWYYRISKPIKAELY
jgi:O-antigen/teichoic acid export membrane protein